MKRLRIWWLERRARKHLSSCDTCRFPVLLMLPPTFLCPLGFDVFMRAHRARTPGCTCHLQKPASTAVESRAN